MIPKIDRPIAEIKGNKLKDFYNSLKNENQEDFKRIVCASCGWTYAIWLNKLNLKSPINRLEAAEICAIIGAFYLNDQDT